MSASGYQRSDHCLQELWKTRSRPKALDVDTIAPRHSKQANALAGGHVPEAGVQPSACRSLGLSDQHKQWSLEENTKVGAEPGVWGGQLQGQWQWCLVAAEEQLCWTRLPLPLAGPADPALAQGG